MLINGDDRSSKVTRTSLRCTRLEQSGMTVGGSAERAFQSMVRLPDLDGVLWADKLGG